MCVIAVQGLAAETPKQVPLEPKVGTYELKPYRYVLTHVIYNDGSITKVGSLFRNGMPVAGTDFYRLELSIGSFIWHPSKPSEYSSCHLVGWIRIDPTKKHSAWTMALIDSKPAPDAKVLRTVERNPVPVKPVKETDFEVAPNKVQ